MVIKSTKVLLKPKNLLSTYKQTKIRYHIVTEPSYKEMQFEGNDSVIRHGVVTAQTPMVVTPDFLYRTSGFGDDAKEYIRELTKMLGKKEPALLYTYKNESTDMEIEAGNPMEVSERLKKRLVNNNANHTVIRGVNALWDVSLLKFIFDYTRESANNNFNDYNVTYIRSVNISFKDKLIIACFPIQYPLPTSPSLCPFPATRIVCLSSLRARQITPVPTVTKIPNAPGQLSSYAASASLAINVLLERFKISSFLNI